MAITTYAELQAAIDNSTTGWMFQDALGGRTTDFITLCEAKMNTLFAQNPVRPQQTRAPFSITGEFVAYPADMLKPQFIEVDSLKWRIAFVDEEYMAEREFSSIDRFNEITQLLFTPAPPEYFTMVGDDFRFQPAPTETFAGQLTYYARIPALSVSNTTNWLLTRHPDAYLWGSLAVAATFTRDPERVGEMAALFSDAMDGVVSSYPKPTSKMTLRMDILPQTMRNTRQIW